MGGHTRTSARYSMVVAAVAALISSAPTVNADEPGCERVPILGLNPQIRKICDGPIQDGGWWARARQFTHPQYTHSTCGAYGVMTRTGYECPWWAPKDTIPADEGPLETYIVTADTIPPGEPGHLD